MSRDRPPHPRVDTLNAEQAVWSLLQRFRQLGFHFSRHQTVGPYIVDFENDWVRVIVELDGPEGSEAITRRDDEVRTKFLEAQGYTVIRLWNEQVFADEEAIARLIEATLAERAPFHPVLGKRPPPADLTLPVKREER